VEIRLDCIPPTATAQQKGAFVCGGRVRFYVKKKVRQSENFLAALLSMHVPDVPFSGPVSLTARWEFPWRKSERRGTVKAGVPIPHTSRPDLDNLEKNLLDVLTRLNFWTDDSLVVEKFTSKCWGPKPGIDIIIRPVSV
jgi:Holliday junction resolvase RusA-like endonuclease